MNKTPQLIGLITLLAIVAGCNSFSPAPEADFNPSMPSTPVVRQVSYIPYFATASSSMPDSSPLNALDGNFDSVWNSGSGPEQWIQIDLGQPTTVRKIRLVVSQFPEGDTIHQIWLGVDVNTLTLVDEFAGFTKDSDTLEYKPAAPETEIRFVRIVTTQSTSWVAWREITIQSP